MVDWIGALKPEELSAYATMGAAAIAAVALLSQASSQRRQTRLALLDRRLVVYEAYTELLRLCLEHSGLLVLRIPDERLDPEITRAMGEVLTLMNNAAMLFEDEVEGLGHQLVDLGHDVQEAALMAKVRGFAPNADSLHARGLGLQALVRQVFAPYIARERRAGIGPWIRVSRFWQRLQLENQRAIEESFLRARPPMNEPWPPDS